MLRFLLGKAGDRKLRLFDLACARRVWQFLPEERRRHIEGIEQGADRWADIEEADILGVILGCVADAVPVGVVSHHLDPYTGIAGLAAIATAQANHCSQEAIDYLEETKTQASILREIIGNPFRPPPHITPSWLTWQGGTIPSLAEHIYADRRLPEGTLDLDRLAVLADALEEAGCTNTDVLGHLRGPGPHVRGCHVVDAILGRT
jgi:hypothetical protein